MEAEGIELQWGWERIIALLTSPSSHLQTSLMKKSKVCLNSDRSEPVSHFRVVWRCCWHLFPSLLLWRSRDIHLQILSVDAEQLVIGQNGWVGCDAERCTALNISSHGSLTASMHGLKPRDYFDPMGCLVRHLPSLFSPTMSFSPEELREICPRFRVLIMGRRNAGKTTILEKMAGVEAGAKPVIRDSQGSLVKVRCSLFMSTSHG